MYNKMSKIIQHIHGYAQIYTLIHTDRRRLTNMENMHATGQMFAFTYSLFYSTLATWRINHQSSLTHKQENGATVEHVWAKRTDKNWGCKFDSSKNLCDLCRKVSGWNPANVANFAHFVNYMFCMSAKMKSMKQFNT